MDISKVITQSAQTDTSTTPTGGSKTLSKDDFLKLLVDTASKSGPSETLENDAFIAQTAQFSQLEKCPSW